MFGESTEGYIHFSAVKQHKKDEIHVDPKLVFQTIDCEPTTITFNQKIKFKSEFLKAFPIILRPGFMFSTVNKTLCQIYLSVMNPKDKFIGECSKYEIINVIQYLLPLWQIFDIYIGKTIKIKFQEDFIPTTLCEESKPILLYISYNLEKPEEITLVKFGNCIELK